MIASPSPWEGMSGAAVWAANRIIGVVAEHHPNEGTWPTHRWRIDRAYSRLPKARTLTDSFNWSGLAPVAGRLPDVDSQPNLVQLLDGLPGTSP